MPPFPEQNIRGVLAGQRDADSISRSYHSHPARRAFAEMDKLFRDRSAIAASRLPPAARRNQRVGRASASLPPIRLSRARNRSISPSFASQSSRNSTVLVDCRARSQAAATSKPHFPPPPRRKFSSRQSFPSIAPPMPHRSCINRPEFTRYACSTCPFVQGVLASTMRYSMCKACQTLP